MSRLRVFSAGAFCVCMPILAMPHRLSAQTVVSSIGGVEFRYRGDTIWRYRDTTITRLVLHGDTSTRTSYVHGVPKSTMVYVQRGDVAMLVQSRDSAGALRNTGNELRSTPAIILSAEAGLIEQALRTSNLRASIPEMPGRDGPPRSETLTRYAFSANTNIEQFKDTVRYIRGCAAAPPVDTTVYLLFGTDSLRRLTPSPRTFDRYMVSAVRGDLGSALLRSRVSQMSAPPLPPIPALRKWPCDNR